MKKVRRAVWECRDGSGSLAVWHLLDGKAWAGALHALRELVPSPRSFRPRAWDEADLARAAQATFLRDIFGNPFRPVALDPAWLTSDVVALARGIYDEKAFDRMPILADALQDAGCENADVLQHCRGEGTHVRGCWVVDLVLDKK